MSTFQQANATRHPSVVARKRNPRSFTVPSSVEFDAQFDGPDAAESTTQSLDELSALNTALCFLCSMNADSQALETFLTRYPLSLLLDGTGMLPEESALYIIESQPRCKCPEANRNRHQIWTVLGRGFEHYQRRNHVLYEQQKDNNQHAFQWDNHKHKLLRLEADIREWRNQEQNLRNRVLEATVELKTLEARLSTMRSMWSSSSSASLSNGSLLFCHNNQHQQLQIEQRQREQRSILEYQIGIGQVNCQSVTREHQSLIRQIGHARKTQFALLQHVFSGVGRFPCSSSSSNGNSNSGNSTTS